MHEIGLFDEIDRFFSPFNIKRLSHKHLKIYKRSYLDGWEYPTEYKHNGQYFALRVLFKSESRYVLPDIAVYPNAFGALEFPHVEEDSRLCIWDSAVCCDFSNFQYLVELLHDAHILLGKLLNGECLEDFRNGFLSYWEYKVSGSLTGVSLCDPDNLGTRRVYLYKSTQYGLIFGDTEEQIRDWLVNRYDFPVDEPQRSRSEKRALSRIFPTVLFCFENAWLPTNYPNTIEELRELVVPEQITDEQYARYIGDALNNQFHRQMGALAAFQTQNGVCYCGLSFTQGMFSPKSKFHQTNIVDGFRKTIPYKHLLLRTSSIKTLGISVGRADNNWVQGRGLVPHLSTINSTKVVIIGCGSVGSSVAKLLAKSGVGRMVLIDGDSLEFANISRHELGASYVGTNKATSLNKELQKCFPQIEVRSFGNMWQSLIDGAESAEFIRHMNEADLIVSATAVWASDIRLISIQEHLDLGPIIFAFTEAHAVASHVVVHPDGSKAFDHTHKMCGESVGSLQTPCSKWDNQTRVKLPLCGGSFQPYGAAALSYLHTLVVETMLRLITGTLEEKAYRVVWMGSTAQLRAVGGTWNLDWIRLYGDPGPGSKAISMVLSNDRWVVTID